MEKPGPKVSPNIRFLSAGFFRLHVLLLLVLAGPAGAGAQSLSWSDISGRTGFSSILCLSDGTLFGRYDFILYRSTDDGETWTNFTRPGGDIFEFVTRGNTALLSTANYRAADYKQHYISTDRAQSWSRISAEGSAGAVHTNMMISADESIYGLFPRSSRMVFERLLNGVWQQVGNPPQVYTVGGAGPPTYTVSDIDDSGNFYIGTVSDGIHSSRDNGQSWTRALSYRYVSTIAFGPDGRVAIGTLPNGRTVGGVFISDDHGATWTLHDLTDVNIRSLKIDTEGDIFAVTDQGLFRRRLGAAAWEEVGPFDFTYDVLAITPTRRYIATGEGFGFLESTDSGENWVTDGVRHQDLYSIASSSNGTLLAGTLGKGYFRSTNSGENWTPHRTRGEPEYFYSLERLGGRVYAGTEKGLYYSADNGVSWVPLTSALNNDSVDVSVYAFGSSQGGDLYIGTGAGVWRSVDGGTSWMAAGLGTSAVRSLTIDPGDRIYVATASDGVYLTTNGGTNWVGRGLVRPDIQTISANGAGDVYVGVAGGVYYSTDGGATWTNKIFTTGHVYSFLFNGNFDTYAATSSGLFGSSDGGQSWSGRGLFGQVVIALSYDPNHAMLAAVHKGGVYRSFQIITDTKETEVFPERPSLSANYPNPFNPVTTIGYDVPSFSYVTLEVFDMLGRKVETLVSGSVSPGRHQASWDASDAPSGVYMYRIRILSPGSTVNGAQPFNASGKMLLVR